MRLTFRPAASKLCPGVCSMNSMLAFSAHLNAAVNDALVLEIPSLVIDLSGLEYMTSKGLRALTLAKNEARGAVTIRLAAPNATMRRILSISRYDMLFPVVDAVDPGS